MSRCPECESTIGSEEDVEFVDLGTADDGISLAAVFRSPKRLYVVSCEECGAVVGGGIAAP